MHDHVPLCVTCHTHEVQEPFIHTSGYGFCSQECETEGNTPTEDTL